MTDPSTSTSHPRPTKRSRPNPSTDIQPPAKKTLQPRLFAPFRALGYITNHIPPAIQVRAPAKGNALGKVNVSLVSCLGGSWAMWDLERMTLLFVGPPTPKAITSLAIHGNEVFASSGSQILRYNRGKHTATYSSDTTTNVGIAQIMIFGGNLLGLEEDGKRVVVWDISSTEIESTLTFNPAKFTATTMFHPATYVNKVLVGGREGGLELWNVKTQSLIHSFPPLLPTSPAITIIAQSPAVDVVGVGHADGTVVIFDVREGEEIMRVRMEGGGVVGLSFRMDGPPILASSSTNGSIALWDLNAKGRLLHTIRDAHEAGVTGLEWIQGQPVLVSSSGDNSIKQWLFDSPTALPRLLKSRTGHHAPLTSIRYHGSDGKQILTASRDRSLRYTSVVRDSRSHELSQGHVAKRASALGVKEMDIKWTPVVKISSGETRSKDWEDVLTAHSGEGKWARSWRVQDKKAGRHSFDVEDGGVVQAVCTTACGNYGLVGSSKGEIRMFNMQSGQHRRTFGAVGGKGKGKGQVNGGGSGAGKKSGAGVTGLVTDSLNRVLISSTLDGTLHFYDFHTTQLEHTIKIPANITAIELHRDSGLLALVCDDMVVRLVDIETRRIVRELAGPRRPILDIAFSPDSRWLITASMDAVVRTYDVPTGQMIDGFRTSSIATGVTFSPTGDFLATAHADSLGVHLWANKAQFSEVALRHIDEAEIRDVALPSVQGIETDDDLEGIEPVGEPEFQDIYTTPEQLADEMLTLSLMPRSRWQTLLNLDVIRARNKPKEAPKAPEQAPFFLPTVTNLDDGTGTRFNVPEKDTEQGSRVLSKANFADTYVESEFTRRLMAEQPTGNFNGFFEYLKSLSPSALDLEIRSLLSIDLLERFLRSLIGRLKSHRDFEAVQAVLSVCLTIHSDLFIANAELTEVLKTLLGEQKRESERLMGLISYNLGTMSFLRGA